jgi:predicted house-cleaning NTP pyrophosphatase (Maf/HAM1 superfamily)
VDFLTGLVLLNTQSGRLQVDCVLYSVYFRRLTQEQIEGYVRREHPVDCAGSFKSEGLGIALFSKMEGEDPTSLIGLPLIRLAGMLQAEGVDVLTEARGVAS